MKIAFAKKIFFNFFTFDFTKFKVSISLIHFSNNLHTRYNIFVLKICNLSFLLISFCATVSGQSSSLFAVSRASKIFLCSYVICQWTMKVKQKKVCDLFAFIRESMVSVIGREPFYHEIIWNWQLLHEVKIFKTSSGVILTLIVKRFFPSCSRIRHGRLRLSLDKINS